MATQWVDFQAVKQVVTMQMVLEHYQVNWLRKNRDELRGRCPIHKGEGANAFHVNVEKNCFQCFAAERGISLNTAKTFGVGFFAGKGSMHGRIVIPIHNEAGELLAYAGRALDDSEEEKYKLPDGFKKSLVVYNLHRAIGRDSTVILVEGYFGCMRLAQAGFTCVSLMGSSLSDTQADLLCQYFNGFVLMFDGDKSGQQVTDECLVKLGRRGQWVRALMLSEGAQPDGLDEAELVMLLEK